jgi:hypothetical protein
MILARKSSCKIVVVVLFRESLESFEPVTGGDVVFIYLFLVTKKGERDNYN